MRNQLSTTYTYVLEKYLSKYFLNNGQDIKAKMHKINNLIRVKWHFCHICTTYLERNE